MTYVLAEMAGVAEAPVYGILDMGGKVEALKSPDGSPLDGHVDDAPDRLDEVRA